MPVHAHAPWPVLKVSLLTRPHQTVHRHGFHQQVVCLQPRSFLGEAQGAGEDQVELQHSSASCAQHANELRRIFLAVIKVDESSEK